MGAVERSRNWRCGRVCGVWTLDRVSTGCGVSTENVRFSRRKRAKWTLWTLWTLDSAYSAYRKKHFRGTHVSAREHPDAKNATRESINLDNQCPQCPSSADDSDSTFTRAALSSGVSFERTFSSVRTSSAPLFAPLPSVDLPKSLSDKDVSSVGSNPLEVTVTS